MFLASAIGYALDIEPHTDIYWLLLLVTDAVVYFVFHKFIKLKNGIPAIEDREIKWIVVAITGILLILFGGARLIASRTHEDNTPLFFSLILSFLLAIVALVFLILHLSKRRKERLETIEIKLALDKLARRHHKYKDVIPAVGASYFAFHGLIEETKNILDQDKPSQIESLRRYLDTMEKISTELGEEFAIDGMEDAVRELSLPDDWYPLEIRLLQIAAQCKQHQIAFFLKNTAPVALWNTLPTSQSEFIRLAGNLVGNAVKELGKMKDKGNQVLVSFFEEAGVFVFEVSDTAHEFPIEILARLGQRGNSTSGTGHGYAEVFAFLDKSSASLEFKEERDEDFSGKGVRVIFDGQARRMIRTTYRCELLQNALADTEFQVEEWSI